MAARFWCDILVNPYKRDLKDDYKRDQAVRVQALIPFIAN
jgi:hypothetical protein